MIPWSLWFSDHQPAKVKVGERLSGKVTNIWKSRVWVDIGLEKDASTMSFIAAGGCSLAGGWCWKVARNMARIKRIIQKHTKLTCPSCYLALEMAF